MPRPRKRRSWARLVGAARGPTYLIRPPPSGRGASGRNLSVRANQDFYRLSQLRVRCLAGGSEDGNSTPLRLLELDIAQPERAGALERNVESNQVRALPCLQIEGDLMQRPGGCALDFPLKTFGEKLTQAGDATPHLEVGAPLDRVCPDVRAIGEPALLDSGRSDREQLHGSSFASLDPPSIFLGRNPALIDRAVGRPECVKGFGRTNRLTPLEQRSQPFEHALNSTSRVVNDERNFAARKPGANDARADREQIADGVKGR